MKKQTQYHSCPHCDNSLDVIIKSKTNEELPQKIYIELKRRE